MFTREHLIIGAAGFVLGGIVATASITVVLSTQKQEPAVAAPPVTAVAPVAAAPATPPASSSPIEPVAAPAPETPAPATAAPVTHTPPPVAAAPKPAKPVPVKPAAAPVTPAPLAAEETDRQAEDAKQLAARKKALDSQVSDSEEIIRLKAQQIRDMEERLKTGH